MQAPLDISQDSIDTKKKKFKLFALVWIVVLLLVAVGFVTLFSVGSYKIITNNQCSGEWLTILLNLVFLFVGIIIPSPVPYKKQK